MIPDYLACLKIKMAGQIYFSSLNLLLINYYLGDFMMQQTQDCTKLINLLL